MTRIAAPAERRAPWFLALLPSLVVLLLVFGLLVLVLAPLLVMGLKN